MMSKIQDDEQARRASHLKEELDEFNAQYLGSTGALYSMHQRVDYLGNQIGRKAPDFDICKEPTLEGDGWERYLDKCADYCEKQGVGPEGVVWQGRKVGYLPSRAVKRMYGQDYYMHLALQGGKYDYRTIPDPDESWIPGN
jgi:hypothetical protein